MKNFDGIVRGAAARQCFITDQSRITDTTHIYSITVKIIMTPLFSGQFADTINSGRCGLGVLRTIFFWSIHTKNRYAAWPENFFKLSSLATSNVLIRLCIFRCQASIRIFLRQPKASQPVNKCFYFMTTHLHPKDFLSMISSGRKGRPFSRSASLFRSAAITVSPPYCCLSASVSSVPICPDAPITSIFDSVHIFCGC